MEQEYSFTRSQLTAAFAAWAADAKAGQWPERTDEDRHADNADFLIVKLQEVQS